MAINERMKYFRKVNGYTQKELGEKLGFENNPEIRITQYETGGRNPKEDMIRELADIFDVSTDALNAPNIDSCVGVMHTLFALEDIYGLTVTIKNGEPYMCFDKTKTVKAHDMALHFYGWARIARKYENGEITEEEYDAWRYKYPKYDSDGHYAKSDPTEMSDMMKDILNKKQ